jgi:cobalt-zinc-cadmium efflux system protein
MASGQAHDHGHSDGHHHGHSHGHAHNHAAGASERGLKIALGLTGAYLVAEVVGGLLTGSLALLSDAAHMLTDVAALAIALVALRLARRPADKKRTFGYYRFEILAAAVNAAVLFLVGFYILYEAWQRFQQPPEIETGWMLGVATLGLIVNLLSMRALQAGSQQSLNMKGAYLEVWSDALGSIAVIGGALIIRFTGWWQVDPILAVLIGLWVLPRTWSLLSESVNILLEGVPEGLSLREIEDALRAVPGVRAVHDLHVWAITSGKNSLTTHLVLDGDAAGNEQRVLQATRSLLVERFGITHTTVQVEAERCDSTHDVQAPYCALDATLPAAAPCQSHAPPSDCHHGVYDGAAGVQQPARDP